MHSGEAAFDRVQRYLCGHNASFMLGKIFHAEGLKTKDKVFVFVRGKECVLKLPRKRVSELISAGVGRPFDAGKGTPMKEWIRISSLNEDMPAYALEAYRFVHSL